VDPQTLPKVLHKEISGEKEQEREISLAEIIGLPDFDVSAARPVY
jgi:ornithine cyclodeaminase/alanine dehydrogenase-like protein (mu-crystallin family)